jgi:uncharacterized membrane protein YfcA
VALLDVPEALTPLTALLVIGAGAIAGFLNVVAGGGSLLAMPVLIFVGLPDTAANGTARIAILVQNVTAAARYHRAGRIQGDLVERFAPPTVVGAIAGAAAATVIPDTGFRQVLAWVMLAAALAVVVGPARLLRRAAASEPRLHPALIWPLFIAVGFYGGLVQAAVGYLLLAVLSLGIGLDLVEANILKVVLVLAYTPIALGILGGGGKVNLWLGLLLAVGQAAGAWVGAAAALKRGATLIRLVLAVTVVVMALELLGVRDILGQ